MKLLKTSEYDYFGRKRTKVTGLTKSGYWLAGTLLAIVLFFVLCFRTVGAGQVGIITRFGEVERTINSGIALKLPYPIERLHKMNIQVQKEEQASAAATSDLQDVKATLALNYALDSSTAINVFKEIGSDYKNRIIVPALQESYKAASAQYTASQLVTERTAVKGKAYEVIKERLEKYGVRVIDLNIVNFEFSPEFNAAIESKQVALQEAEKQKVVAEQQTQKARLDLERIKVEAEQALTRAQAEAESTRLKQTSLTPEALRNREIDTQQQAIAKWNGALPTTSGIEGFFNLPIK